MKKALAVLIRALAAAAVLSLAGAVLKAAERVPALGAGNAFAIAALVDGAIESLPWTVAIFAWYLAVVTGKRIKSRVLSHGVVFALSAAFLSLGLATPPGTASDAAAHRPVTEPADRFIRSDTGFLIASAWTRSAAKGVATIDFRRSPSIDWHDSVARDGDGSILRLGPAAVASRPEWPERNAAYRAPFRELVASSRLFRFQERSGAGAAVLILAFAWLATGVRFPIRMSAWTMPGAMLGLFFALSAPGLFAAFGSETLGEAFALAGLPFDPETAAPAFAAATGLLLLALDLSFRPADDPADAGHA